MTTSDIARSIRLRLIRPATWGGILGFELAWVVARLLSGVPFKQLPAWEFLVPALFLAGHLAFSAVPWQWTGDTRSTAPMWRGFLQALPWNAAWVLLMLWGVHDLVKPSRPPREPRSPAQNQRPVQDSRRDPGPRRDEAPRRNEHPRWDEDPNPPPPPSPNHDPMEAQDERPAPPPGPPRDREASPEPREERPRTPPPGLPQELKLLLLNLPFAMIVGWFLAEKERAESKERELAALARDAHAKALQSQLHPHTLYNTLSGLTELVHEDPDAAEEALIALMELLRTLTRHAAAKELPLAQERTLVRHFLRIEEIRLGPRLTVAWTWPDWADALVLPPLLLQPLVENAIKHGIAPCPEGGALKISVFKAGLQLVFRVANTGQPLNEEHREGVGLLNLRERLSLMERLSPTLDLRTEEKWTVAELRLNIS